MSIPNMNELPQRGTSATSEPGHWRHRDEMIRAVRAHLERVNPGVPPGQEES